MIINFVQFVQQWCKNYVPNSDLRQVGGFPRVLQFPTPIKLIATI